MQVWTKRSQNTFLKKYNYDILIYYTLMQSNYLLIINKFKNLKNKHNIYFIFL